MTPYYQDEHVTIYHGDTRDVLPLCPRVDIVLTDPPWELSESAIEIRGTGVSERHQPSKTLTKGQVGTFDLDIIRWCQDLAINDCLFLCGYKELADLAKACDPLRGIFAWHKPNGAPAAFYPAKIDLSFIVWTGKKSLLYGYQHWPSMVFSVPFPPAGCFASERFVDASGKAIHPCQGPLELYRRLLAPFESGKLVLDCYAGTGTALRAAKDCGLNAIGVEREERYCEIAAERMRQKVLF